MHTIIINPDGAFDVAFIMPNGEQNVLTTRNSFDTAAEVVALLNGGVPIRTVRHLDRFLLETIGLIAEEKYDRVLNQKD